MAKAKDKEEKAKPGREKKVKAAAKPKLKTKPRLPVKTRLKARPVAPKRKPLSRPAVAGKKAAPKPAAAVVPKAAPLKTVPLPQAQPVFKPPAAPKPATVVPPPAAPVKPAAHPARPPVAPAAEKPAIKPIPKPQPAQSAPIPPAAPAAVPVAAELKELELNFPINVKDLSVKLQEKPSAVIKALMSFGVMAGINQQLDEAAIAKVCQKYGFKIKKAAGLEEAALSAHEESDAPQDLLPRPPIVTFMGHVDHGKTSLLDAIRKTKVAESEHGGITQHIGAYRVILPAGEITFLDTPGHEAFSAMRARGAKATDIVVLVVAADDGIMPQTEEAIDHARAAGVSLIVAINKVDKPQADLDRVKKQLQKTGLAAEDWGGKTITCPVSAKTGQGIDNLLEMILLEAQMLELKANPKRQARGVVIEARMEKGRGPVSTLLVQNGTLHLNSHIIVGRYYGKVRAMFDDRGRSITVAGPSCPAEVLGITGLPEAGEQFFVVADEKKAKEISAERIERGKAQQIRQIQHISLEELHARIAQGKLKELKIVIKSDVQGSLEAIKDTLAKLNVAEIKLEVIHAGVGNINSSDVILAAASDALVLGFNVTQDERAREISAEEGIEVKSYNIIYELANDIKLAVEGMLEPKTRRVFSGKAEIKKVFRLSRSGTVAGCMVSKGKINRVSLVNILRNGEVIFEGKLSSLKRFKDDVRDVQEGYECGMAFAGFDQMLEGDVVEAYEIEKIARKL
jgi:translation initiation factor IF-2